MNDDVVQAWIRLDADRNKLVPRATRFTSRCRIRASELGSPIGLPRLIIIGVEGRRRRSAVAISF
jgi:hypothetical protein